MKSTIVAVNGVYQQINQDFVAKGHTIVFKQAPDPGDNVQLTTFSGGNHNTAGYYGTGKQTTFNLPAFPRTKFEVVPHTGKDWVPTGFVVIDVDTEIDLWIRENCPASDWKWADQLDEAIGFNMSRLVVRESIVTYIATRWSE